MKNKFLALLIVALMLISSVGTAFAAEGKTISVIVDGNQIVFDVPPTSENGRTLVPMRYIFEALGAEVNWIPEENKAVATKGDITVELVLGSDIMTRNGKEITLDVPAKAINGRTLVPARAVAEALDAKVNWIPETYIVNILSEGASQITEANEADARKTLDAFCDALLDFDFQKMAEYCTNSDKLKATLPQGDYLNALIADMVAASEDLKEATDEELEAVIAATIPLVEPVVQAFLDSIDISVADVKADEGIYTYTLNIAMPDINNLNESLSSEAFESKLEEISNSVSQRMAISSYPKPMTEEEALALYMNLIGEELKSVIEKEIAETGKITESETMSLVYQNGTWRVVLDSEDKAIFDYEAFIKTIIE